MNSALFVQIVCMKLANSNQDFENIHSLITINHALSGLWVNSFFYFKIRYPCIISQYLAHKTVYDFNPMFQHIIQTERVRYLRWKKRV